MIVFKITDPVQYKLSCEHDIDVESIVRNTSKKTLFDKNYHRVYSAVDSIESNDIISKDKFYIFPIFYNHTEKTNTLPNWRKEIKSYISRNINIFKKANVKVCLCDPYETSMHFIESVEILASLFDLEFLVITANKKFYTNSKNVYVIYNDLWIEKFPPIENILPYKPERLYINLNRQTRIHRCLLMDSLIENSLFEHGYNTWGNLGNWFEEYKTKINPNTKIDQVMYDILDVKDFVNVNPNYFVPVKQCTRSFLFLNTETNIDPNQLFFSEKVYKPIGIGMPFITLGNPGTLRDLQNRGFITFSDWFDESYDDNLDITKRVNIVIENIKKYAKYSSKDLKKIRLEMNEVLYYNLKLYSVIHKKNWLKENIELYVRNRQ